MKYTKGKAPFALKDGKKTLIQTFHQSPKEGLKGNSYTRALMVTSAVSDKMVLEADAKCLLPAVSRGAILDRSHNVNLADIETLEIHPEIWDKLVADGVIDKDGNPVGKKAAKPAPAPAAAPEPAPRTEAPADPASPLDVNKDGVVDAKDTAEVATAVAESEAIDAMTLPQLKKKYKEVFGKAPGSNWKKLTIVKKLKASL
jgi:pyruvate/2-oxoglutarate dehydrogenase complex dihydrolipoamide acyltransferase (E2) component